MTQISVLCTNENSIYKKLGLDCYDIKRNARTYTGSNPVIAHPPCRGWSAFMSHWAKPAPGEKDLAYFCLEKIAMFGGVLEHPAHSRFIKIFIGNPKYQIITVDQKWWGHPVRKRTWLLMPADYQAPQPPFQLEMQDFDGSTIKDGKKFERMSKNQRSETNEKFANYLIETINDNI